MGDTTDISWAGSTWNTHYGCMLVSAGCANCYAAEYTSRFSGPGQRYDGLAYRTNKGKIPVFTGRIQQAPTHLSWPAKWAKKGPRRIFVNSLSDTFHESVPDEYLDRIFDVMETVPVHTYLILTKRPERMRDYVTRRFRFSIGVPPNIWLGTSVESQDVAEQRIRPLLQTPAHVRWISAEPLIGPLDLERFLWAHDGDGRRVGGPYSHLHWVVAGGESGPESRRREMDPDWIRLLRDQCVGARAAFYFKQSSGRYEGMSPYIDGFKWTQWPDDMQPPTPFGSCPGEDIRQAFPAEPVFV